MPTVTLPTGLPVASSVTLDSTLLAALDMRYVQQTLSQAQTVYCCDGSTTAVGPNTADRSTILPPDTVTAKNYISIAGTVTNSSNTTLATTPVMDVGCYLDIEIHGSLLAPIIANRGLFNVQPWVIGKDGIKRDLGAANWFLSDLGIMSRMLVRCKLLQTNTGILVSGFALHAPNNRTLNTFQLNTSKLITVSDPSEDRTFGIDGQWQLADPSNGQQTISAAANLWKRR